MRVTKTDLRNMVNRLNAINGITDADYYTVGAYRLSESGYGLSIEKVENECGGVQNVGNISGMTTKECYYFLSGLLANL